MQIQEGKYYRRRDGAEIGPAVGMGHWSYPWVVNGLVYNNYGYFIDQQTPHDYDLIEEVPAPNAEADSDGYFTVAEHGWPKPEDYPVWVWVPGKERVAYAARPSHVLGIPLAIEYPPEEDQKITHWKPAHRPYPPKTEASSALERVRRAREELAKAEEELEKEKQENE
jgi:hypothetical protein